MGLSAGAKSKYEEHKNKDASELKYLLATNPGSYEEEAIRRLLDELDEKRRHAIEEKEDVKYKEILRREKRTFVCTIMVLVFTLIGIIEGLPAFLKKSQPSTFQEATKKPLLPTTIPPTETQTAELTTRPSTNRAPKQSSKQSSK